MKARVYVETTIPSYLTSRPSRELIIAAHQQITQEWWDRKSGPFQLSPPIRLDEASAGNAALANARLSLIQALPLLDATPDVPMPASAILDSDKLPGKAATDAAHIAVAAVPSTKWYCL
jgi:hypothetical protein